MQFNLGWKLALVEQRLAPRALLATYSEERLPVIQRMLQETTVMRQRGKDAVGAAPEGFADAVAVLCGLLGIGRSHDVLDQLSGEHRAEVIALLSSMRSGRGFVNDLAQLGGDGSPGRGASHSRRSSSRRGAMVPFPTAMRSNSRGPCPRAELVDSEAAGHFVWFGPDRNRIEQLITAFLAQGATAGGG